jgi:hypothetical protein
MPEPSSPLPCAYQLLPELLAAIDRTPPPDELPPCDAPAEYSVQVVRKRLGQDVEIWTAMCAPHQVETAAVPGVGRSMHLRHPKPRPDLTRGSAAPPRSPIPAPVRGRASR